MFANEINNHWRDKEKEVTVHLTLLEQRLMGRIKNFFKWFNQI